MEHWSEYWSSDAAFNSFAEGSNATGYAGSIAAYWDSVFSILPSDTQLLDIGTGNGALAMLARKYSQTNGLSFSITAIDAAIITPFITFQHQPALLKSLEGINFFGETRIESTSFKSQSFDFLCSQFGFEYSNLNIALIEVVRLLKPKGRFVAICHHKDSAITLTSQCGVEVLDYVLHKTPIFPVTNVIVKLASQALPQVGEIGWKSSVVYQSLKDNVFWLLKEVSHHYASPSHQEWINDVFNRIKSVLENCNVARVHDLERFLAFHYRELLMQKQRIEDQCNAALDEEDILALKESLVNTDVVFEANVKNFEDSTKAWELLLTRT